MKDSFKKISTHRVGDIKPDKNSRGSKSITFLGKNENNVQINAARNTMLLKFENTRYKFTYILKSQ